MICAAHIIRFAIFVHFVHVIHFMLFARYTRVIHSLRSCYLFTAFTLFGFAVICTSYVIRAAHVTTESLLNNNRITTELQLNTY